jgi:hypothetical protein
VATGPSAGRRVLCLRYRIHPGCIHLWRTRSVNASQLSVVSRRGPASLAVAGAGVCPDTAVVQSHGWAGGTRVGPAGAWGEVKNEFGDRVADGAIFLGVGFCGYADARLLALALALILCVPYPWTLAI